MESLIRTEREIKKIHENKALINAINRRFAPSTSEEIKRDWFYGKHMLGRDLAEFMVHEMYSNKDYEIMLSDALIPYLEEISVDDYKETLAWLDWKEYFQCKIDDNKGRIDHDWFLACDFIRDFLTSNSKSIQPDPSVEEYLDDTYNKNRAATVDKKAFLNYLAYPQNDSITNHGVAETYVDNFIQLIKVIFSGNISKIPELCDHILDNPQMANMIEFNILKIQKIIQSPSS